MNNKKTNLRYIAYVRKSEERKERQELSHQSQINEIRKKFPDLDIVKWMEPESKSAFKPGRPLFDEMLKMIDSGKADAIVAWHPNRLSRNEIDSARLTYMLRDRLKDLKFCSYSFDNSAEGIMMLQMVMNQSQYESSKQGRDVKRGMAQKAANGEKPGQVPQGYIKVPVLDESGGLIKHKDKVVTETKSDPERYDLVKKMWTMLLSGRHNAAQIRNIANNEWHFTTRKSSKLGGIPITSSMIYKIFNNPFYAGYIRHNGELYKGNYEPMITLEQFDYAQTLLGKKGKPRTGVNPYAYTGIMKCGECGCSIVAKTNTKFVKRDNSTKVYVHYYCTRKSEKYPCTQSKYTSVETLEKEIDNELSKYTILPEFRDLALKILRRNNKIEVKERSQVYNTQQKSRNEIQSQLDKLVDMRTRDLLDDDEYTYQRNLLKRRRDKIDSQLRNTEERAEDWLKLTEKAFDFATYARVRFNETKDLGVKRDILMTLGENLQLKDQKLTFNPSEWLVPISEEYPSLEKEYLSRVGTNKKASSKEKEEAISRIFDSWRARRGSNPRHPA